MDYLSELVSFLLGAVSGWSLKLVIDRSSRGDTTQVGNSVGGDMAGRDLHKK